MRNIPTIGFILVFINFVIPGNAQTFQPVSEQSSIEFRIKNMGINTKGTLSGLRGTILFDEAKLSTSYCKVMVDATSIDTRSKGRDNHIKKVTFWMCLHFLLLVFSLPK